MEPFAVNFLVMMVALALVLALAWWVLRIMRDRAGFGAMRGQGDDDALRFVRALSVGTKERVVIVEHRGKRWMLGVTAGGISTIDRWDVGDGEGGEGSE